jgi:hypothetical protein
VAEFEKLTPIFATEKPDASKQIDEWWASYLDRVRESVTAAERYLDIPIGTISSISQEPDFVAVVKAYAVIEPMLNDLISARAPRPSLGILALAISESPDRGFQAFVSGLNIGGRVGKVALAKSLGLLRDDQVQFVEAVARVRNRYAHNVKNMHRSFADILLEEQRGNGNIVQQITGLQIKLPNPSLAPTLKLFMYHRLADYLSNALDTLKPPPLPMGSLFGLGVSSDEPDNSQ